MWTIVPDTDPNYDQLNPKRIGYTYLHGQLQDDCGFDCFGLINCDELIEKEPGSYVNDSLIKDAAYPCIYKDKLCTFFFWHCSWNRPHGLVVYNTDIEAYNDAKEKFTEKTNRI